MKTYIKNNINGYYIEYPEEISLDYWRGKIGTTYNDFLNGMWVLLSEEQVAFHEEYPNASVKEVLDMSLTPQPERTLVLAKAEKIAEIEQYDSSDDVNSFSVVNGEDTVDAWLTPAERANYRSSIDAAELMEVSELNLYIGDMPITLPINTAKLMLALILLYADQCFIVTKQHKALVEALDSILAVDGYDITKSYPPKLTFNISLNESI